MVRIIDDKEFGTIRVTFRRNARNLVLRVHPNCEVHISSPFRISSDVIYSFLESRRDFVREAMEKQNQRGQMGSIFTPSTPFRTRNHTLELTKSARRGILLERIQGKIRVIIPNDLEWEDSRVQKIIKKAIIETLRLEAHTYLPKKLYETAHKHGFSVKGLSLKYMKSRWGSCTSKTTLNLNLFLVQLPDHLIEHVILHELCHTKVMNHSARFYSLMQKHNPLSPLHDQEIKKYNPTRFHSFEG